MTLHYFNPHYTYMHHPQFDYSSWYKGKIDPNEKFRKLKANSGKYSEDDINFLVGLYREEIKFTDSHIGRLLEELNKRGLDQNTLIIFMADHGEEFLEHGSMGHSHTLYNELTHVPLIFSMTGLVPAQRLEQPAVSTIDIMPTIEGLFQEPKPQSY